MAADDDSVLPIALTFASFGAFLYVRNRYHARRRERAAEEPRAIAETATTLPGPTGAGWQWPVPLWGDYCPVISDGWGSPRKNLDGTPRLHYGVDLMFPRRSLSDKATEFPPGTPAGSKWHFMPTSVPVLAAAAGIVVYAQRTARGQAVQINHGGWSTFYQHLTNMRVTVGQAVPAGHILGDVGGDPTNKNPLRHLHFEIWRGNTQRAAIDPKSSLVAWNRIRLTPLPDGNYVAQTLPPPRHLA